MHRVTFILLSLVCILSFEMTAQSTIRVDADPAIERLSQQFIQYHRETDELAGWRVQLLATSDRRAVEQARSSFVRKFPEYKVQWEYSEPFYRLRVGAFQTRLEANTLLIKLRSEYPAAVLTRVSNLKTEDFLLKP